MKKIFYLILLLFVCSFAHAEYFTIENYSNEIFLQSNSVIEVKEELTVRFTSPRHGIFRKIPYKYDLTGVQNLPAEFTSFSGSAKDDYKLNIYDINVENYNYKISKDDNFITIRIGSANKYVRGRVKYNISYKVAGGILNFKDRQEFYWNLIGTEWPVSIEKSTFSIFLPKPLNLNKDDFFLFRGSYGEKKEVDTVKIQPKTIYGSTEKPFSPGEGLTVGIKFPAGYFGKISYFKSLQLFISDNWALFIPIFVLVALFTLWYFIGRDKSIIDVVHYKIPDKITPAEAGFIIDDKGDNRDLTSLIFYWASKGFISIEEVEDEGFFSSKDYILTKEKELNKDAKPFEKTIFYGLFPANTTNVRVSTLKDNFYTYMKQAKEQLREEINKSGVYEGFSRQLGRLMKSAATIILFTGIYLGASLHRMDFIIAGVLTSVIVFIFGYIMPKKTDAGLKRYQKVKGFKDFINMVEEPKLKIFLKKDPSYFDKTLPYAVVFGLTTKWAEKFENILTSPPSWYRSRTMDNFSLIYLASSIESSAKSMSSTMSSQPKSSGSGGFGGGGGFSGGGFGGGGGGSW
ncbi:DUF2207 domain-containing protein [Flexistipes sinusarabici]|uniref:DUF2207 domain-containing protein n=1 Tax=Flexistipes sinusarabici TaxID=2352 RepID=UPI002355BF50|nr:DUF2207 domain-containing protein [Flexistipes sinusarabici]